MTQPHQPADAGEDGKRASADQVRWLNELAERKQSMLDALVPAAAERYRRVSDPLGYPAPSMVALQAAVAGALAELAKCWNEDAAVWANSGRRGGKGVATATRQCAARVSGVAVDLDARTLAGTEVRANELLATNPISQANAELIATRAELAPTKVVDEMTLRSTDADGNPIFDIIRSHAEPAPVESTQTRCGHAANDRPTVSCIRPPHDSGVHAALDGSIWPYDAPGQYLTQAAAFIAGATDQHADPAYAQNGAAPMFADPMELPGMWELADLVGGQTDVDLAAAPLGLFADPTEPAQRMVSFAELAEPIELSRHPDHRSVSQLQTYTECGLRYRLQRYHGDDAPEVPQWALVGGNAFHLAVERAERWRLTLGGVTTIDPEEAWGAAFKTVVDQTVTESGQPRLETWRASARGKEGYDWWRVEGADMFARYLEWVQKMRADGWALVSRGTEPAIEVPFEITFGGVRVEGKIDQVWHHTDYGYLVVDLKSGARMPDDALQLAVYAHATAMLRSAGGWPVLPEQVGGAYFRARTGELVDCDPAPAVAYPADKLAYLFGTMNAAELAGVYLPHPSSFCGGCSVRYACPVVG